MSSLIDGKVFVKFQLDVGEKTHTLPCKLEPPPTQWHGPYDELAKECSLSLSLGDAFAEVVKIRHSVLE